MVDKATVGMTIKNLSEPFSAMTLKKSAPPLVFMFATLIAANAAHAVAPSAAMSPGQDHVAATQQSADAQNSVPEIEIEIVELDPPAPPVDTGDEVDVLPEDESSPQAIANREAGYMSDKVVIDEEMGKLIPKAFHEDQSVTDARNAAVLQAFSAVNTTKIELNEDKANEERKRMLGAVVDLGTPITTDQLKQGEYTRVIAPPDLSANNQTVNTQQARSFDITNLALGLLFGLLMTSIAWLGIKHYMREKGDRWWQDIREPTAVTISIISFGLIYLAMAAITEKLGIPTYIYFDEPVSVTMGAGRQYSDAEIDGERTDVGYFLFAASIMLAWRIYHWVKSGKLGGRISRESHTNWLFWLAGITSYIFLTTPIWYIDGMPTFLKRIIVFGCAVGIFWLARKKHEKAIEKIRKSEDAGA